MDRTSIHRKTRAAVSTLIAALGAASCANANPVTEIKLSEGTTPTGIVAGPDGNLWFAEDRGHIGRMQPNGTYVEFALPSGSKLLQMVVGPDDNLWFVEPQADNVARMTTSGVTKEWNLGCTPVGFITNGPHNSLWFPERCAGVDIIGEIKALGTAAGTITKHGFSDSSGRGVSAIMTGADGNIWFAETSKNAVGRLNVTTGGITEFPISGAANNLMRVTRGPDNNVWFAFGSTLGRITPEEAIEEFDLPDDMTTVNFMTAAPDGSLWATDFSHGWLWRTTLTPAGFMASKFSIHALAGLVYITLGPDSNLWFTENLRDEIGHIVPDVVFFDGLGDDP